MPECLRFVPTATAQRLTIARGGSAKVAQDAGNKSSEQGDASAQPSTAQPGGLVGSQSLPVVDGRLFIDTSLLGDPTYVGRVIATLRAAHPLSGDGARRVLRPSITSVTLVPQDMETLRALRALASPTPASDRTSVPALDPRHTSEEVELRSLPTVSTQDALKHVLSLVPSDKLRDAQWMSAYVKSLENETSMWANLWRRVNPKAALDAAEQVREVATEYARQEIQKIHAVMNDMDAQQRSKDIPDSISEYLTSSWSHVAVPAGLLLALFGGNVGLVIGSIALVAGGSNIYARYHRLMNDWKTQAVLRDFIQHGADREALKRVEQRYGSTYAQACRDFLMGLKVGVARKSILSRVEQEVFDRAALLVADHGRLSQMLAGAIQ